jgi:hypothetical protein
VKSAEATKPVVTENSLDRPLAPAETLELARADFPAEGPVRVALWLPEPSTDAEPRPVRIFSQNDQRGLQTQGILDASRTRVSVELDPEWLQPAIYFVEVQTTERLPLAVRRYAIVVR